jgi:hypothetical protein
MYKTEADFSRSLSGKLTKSGCRVTRIESHATGNGIPDMFVDGRGVDAWIELKNNPQHSIYSKTIKVAWRPGQVPWAYEYFRHHCADKCSLTLVACCDGIIFIPMIELFKGHTIYNPKGIATNDLKKFNLPRIIAAMTDVIWKGQHTYLDCINKLVDEYYPGIDYDPECLFNPDLLDRQLDMYLFNMAKLDMIVTLEATIINNKS